MTQDDPGHGRCLLQHRQLHPLERPGALLKKEHLGVGEVEPGQAPLHAVHGVEVQGEAREMGLAVARRDHVEESPPDQLRGVVVPEERDCGCADRDDRVGVVGGDDRLVGHDQLAQVPGRRRCQDRRDVPLGQPGHGGLAPALSLDLPADPPSQALELRLRGWGEEQPAVGDDQSVVPVGSTAPVTRWIVSV